MFESVVEIVKGGVKLPAHLDCMNNVFCPKFMASTNETTETIASCSIILSRRETWTSEEATKEYNEVFKPRKARKTVLKYLNDLCDIGYLTDVEAEDRRKKSSFLS